MRKHGAYARPGAIDPWVHNEGVQQRKKFLRLARQFRAASRQPGIRGLATSLRDLGVAAQHAADSFRGLSRTVVAAEERRNRPRDPRIADDLDRRGVA